MLSIEMNLKNRNRLQITSFPKFESTLRPIANKFLDFVVNRLMIFKIIIQTEGGLTTGPFALKRLLSGVRTLVSFIAFLSFGAVTTTGP